MKRRKFIESVSGIAVGSSVLPFVTANTLGNLMYGCTAKTVLPPNGSESTWINTEPLRLAWFRLSPRHASSDPEAVADSLVKADFNCIMNTAVEGGAYYQSGIPFNEPCSALPEGGDFYGGVAALAKQNNMRTGARFDFTQQSKAALEAHPEWFIRHKDGSTVTDANGRSKPCLNSSFYPTQGVSIISEVLDRFEPDFVYLNWFVNFIANTGICYCESCEKGFREKYGRPLPDEPDADFVAFIEEAGTRTTSIIANAIYNKRPGTLYINADNDHADDGHHLETHQGDWIYCSSEQINRQRTSYPGRVGIDMWFSYTGDPSQFDPMLLEEMKVRYHQFGANGSPLSFCTDGTSLNPSHQFELEEAARMNAWHKENADLYGLQVNRSRVLLLCRPETAPRWRDPLSDQTDTGIYTMLTEAHIPVAVSENPDSLVNASQTYDLVIATQGAPVEGLQEYVENGGRALFINQAPPFGIPSMVREVSDAGTGYVEIRDPDAFPSVAGTKYIKCSGSYIPVRRRLFQFANAEPEISKFYVYPDDEAASLTFVNPVSEEPLEPSDLNLESTDIPALITRDVGKGRIAFVPWDIGGYYNRELLPVHAGLFTDIVDSLLQDGRQIISNAPVGVEMVFMYQPDKQRSILHLINCSGKTQDGFREPEIFRSIDIDLAGDFSSARARVSGIDLEISGRNGRSMLTLPELNRYEAIVLS